MYTATETANMITTVMKSLRNKEPEKPKPKRQLDNIDAFLAELDAENGDVSDNWKIGPEHLYTFFRNASSSRRPTKKTKNSHYSADLIVEIEDRNGDVVPIRCLLDTGTSSTILLRQFIKKGRAKSYKDRERTTWNTLGGQFSTNRKALVDFKFPELSTDKKVTWIAHVDDKTNHEHASYDMIIGMDLMTELGIYVNTAERTIKWHEMAIPLKQRGDLTCKLTRETLYHLAYQTEVLTEAEERHARILDTDYSAQDTTEWCRKLNHLSYDQQSLLINTLNRHESLFQGGLGILDVKPIHLEVMDGAVPYHSRPFPIPRSLEATTKKEIDRLTGINMFKKSHDSEWAAPTFVQPKKTGDVRILTDFRRLNAQLKRKPFPLPKISDLLQKLTGFKYATAIDLSMGYYHIPLDEESQRLCTTILPWGKYQYLRLPMGINNSPDIFQSIMMDLLGDLEYARTYIDDILITSSGSYEDHMQKLDEVLKRLEKAGFRARINKCYFAENDVEYLGYQLTQNRIQPQPKKVEAILRIAPPKTKRQLRHFLGMVNFYRDVWRRRSHILAPLTALVSPTAKFKWGKEEQEAFDTMKKVIGKEALLTFPDFAKPFHVYTDASDYQLGAVIMQDNKPLAFYSRKMNSAQRNYTTGEQELLTIVETLKEFRNILLGQEIVVHTDHMNIVYGNLSNSRIARWRLLLEEFGPKYQHIAGKDNVVADVLSRMEANFEDPVDLNLKGDSAQLYTHAMTRLMEDDVNHEFNLTNRVDVAFAFDTSKADASQFPLKPTLIAYEQKRDKQLMKSLQTSSPTYDEKNVEGVSLITYNDKIVIPKILRERVLSWYHHYLVHPGATRMEATMRQTMTWPGLQKDWPISWTNLGCGTDEYHIFVTSDYNTVKERDLMIQHVFALRT